jgi:hypothetical protein
MISFASAETSASPWPCAASSAAARSSIRRSLANAFLLPSSCSAHARLSSCSGRPARSRSASPCNNWSVIDATAAGGEDRRELDNEAREWKSGSCCWLVGALRLKRSCHADGSESGDASSGGRSLDGIANEMWESCFAATNQPGRRVQPQIDQSKSCQAFSNSTRLPCA